MATADDDGSRVFRVAGVSPKRMATFYESVFAWKVDTDREDPSFEDGTGHVVGHVTADLTVAGEAGVRPCIYVERVDETLARVTDHGGAVVTPVYPRETSGWPRSAIRPQRARSLATRAARLSRPPRRTATPGFQRAPRGWHP